MTPILEVPNNLGGHAMKLECETISAKVNVAMLEKADRLFRNDDDGIWIELLQNARRAGAAAVDISVKEVQATSGQCEITIRDNAGDIWVEHGDPNERRPSRHGLLLYVQIRG